MSFKNTEYPGDPSCINQEVEQLSLFALIGCDGPDIILPGGFEIERDYLASIVMAFDVVICFWFIFCIKMMRSYIVTEAKVTNN